VTRVTVCGTRPNSVLRCFRAGRKAPTESHQTQSLPTQVRRQYEKPCDPVTRPDPSAQVREELSVPLATVCSKNAMTNEINGHWHHDEPEEQEADKQACFFADDSCQWAGIFGHNEIRSLEERILAHDPGQVNPAGLRETTWIWSNQSPASASGVRGRVRRRSTSTPRWTHAAENKR